MARWVITLKKVIMILVPATSWAIRTVTTVATMDHVADRKDAVSPFYEKGRMTVILIADDGVVMPINITGERPRPGRNYMVANSRLINHMANGIGDIASDRNLPNKNAANAGGEE